MRLLVIAGFVVLLLLQHSYWFGDSGYFKQRALQQQLAAQQAQMAKVAARNHALSAEVAGFRLDGGRQAVEARARSELGMVRAGETFFLLIEP